METGGIDPQRYISSTTHSVEEINSQSSVGTADFFDPQHKQSYGISCKPQTHVATAGFSQIHNANGFLWSSLANHGNASNVKWRFHQYPVCEGLQHIYTPSNPWYYLLSPVHSILIGYVPVSPKMSKQMLNFLVLDYMISSSGLQKFIISDHVCRSKNIDQSW